MVSQKYINKRTVKKTVFGSSTPPLNKSRSKLRKAETASDEVDKLRRELELLTSFSTDTIYRLRYDTMEYDYISPAIRRLLGFSPQEMSKISLRELIVETRIVTDGMTNVESFADLEQKRREGNVNKWQADYLIKTKDGRKIWVSDVSYPWFDDVGKVIGSVGSLRDITDRVEAENKIKEEFTQIANTDSLTDLSNRRIFFDRLEQEITRLKRIDSEVSILIIDVDHFKEINDTYGHDVGDSVLVEIAKVMQSCLRETDLASRIGGEEFAILLPDTPTGGAGDAAERIRSAIVKHNFELGHDKKPVGVTVSIGVATVITGQDITSSELYKIADTRLYIAKNSGRNQTSVDHIQHTH